ncbi:MAG: DUF3048 domain-containing protein [Christensenellaceae bacterium]|jgi:hypothetical protein
MKKNRFLFLLIILVLLAMGLLACKKEGPPVESFSSAPPSVVSETPSESPTEEIPTDISWTTGRKDTTTIYKPVIVQIDNEPPARPQEGLQLADIVYETLIEGSDTRLTCIFNDVLYTAGAAEKITVGPVRSSRYYHQYIQSEWDGLYVHMGGPDSTHNSESAIWGANGAHIKQRINGAGKYAVNSNMFYKNKNGDPVSHFAMTDLVADAAIYDYEPEPLQQFKFYPLEAYAEEKEIEGVQLSFLRTVGFVEYRYDKETDLLTRYMNDKPFTTDETGEAVTVQNLIVQYTVVEGMPGDDPLKRVNMFGEGRADFFIHGKHLTGRWERADIKTPTKYYLDSGEEVTLAPGNTWVAVHPLSKEVLVTYADGTEDTINPAS